VDVFEEFVDQVVDADALGFRAVIEQDAMAEDGVGQGDQIFGRHAGSAQDQGPDLGAEDEELTGAEPGAPTDPVVDEGGAGFLPGTGRGGEPDGGADEVLGNRDFADELVDAEDVFAGEQGIDGFRVAGGGAETTATSSSSGR
jgi:hypothetical protein